MSILLHVVVEQIKHIEYPLDFLAEIPLPKHYPWTFTIFSRWWLVPTRMHSLVGTPLPSPHLGITSLFFANHPFLCTSYCFLYILHFTCSWSFHALSAKSSSLTRALLGTFTETRFKTWLEFSPSTIWNCLPHCAVGGMIKCKLHEWQDEIQQSSIWPNTSLQ